VATDHFDRKEARKLDRFAQYALVSSNEAIKDSGFDLETVDKFRVGVMAIFLLSMDLWGQIILQYRPVHHQQTP